METRERLVKFLKTIQKELNEHCYVAHELRTEAKYEKNSLDDSKFHDGQTAMADRLEVKFKVFFSEELKR